MQKKCRFENKLVKPENWTGQEFTFSPTVRGRVVAFRSPQYGLLCFKTDLGTLGFNLKL
jgi:hypothetical protein